LAYDLAGKIDCKLSVI